MSQQNAVFRLVMLSIALLALMGGGQAANAADATPVAAVGAAPGAAVSCECEASACAPCEVETGVSFYSAKCGASLERVKSCKKPSCAAVENQKQCLALLGIKAPDVAAQGSAPGAATEVGSVREPASSAGQKKESRAGVIERSEGAALVIRATGPTEAPREGTVMFNGDVIETKLNGKVRVRLQDGSEMTVAASSRVVISSVQVNEQKGTRKVALELLVGKVRSHVTKKYEGENSYTIKTKTAVAGVRGTDFVASFEPGEKEWVSEIRTLEGSVRFDRVRAPGADPAKPADGVDVPVGTYASLTIGPPQRRDDDAEFFKSIDDGTMSPVLKMKDEDIEVLKSATEFAVFEKNPARSTASGTGSTRGADADQLCSAPAGKFKQCSFTCEGGAANAKTCRTDHPGVACVRRLCTGNGVWTEPSRLPASEAAKCVPGRAVVADCGGYW